MSRPPTALRALQWGCLAVAALGMAGLVILYVCRADFYAATEVVPASLGALYPVSDRAVAIDRLAGGASRTLGLGLRNADGCAPWNLVVDGTQAGRLDAAAPGLPLEPGRHRYALSPKGCTLAEPAIDAIELDLFFGAAGGSAGLRTQGVTTDQIQLNAANVPVLMNAVGGFERWVPDVVAADPAAAAEAMAALKRAGFDPTAGTREKIIFLVDFVRAHMPSGSPPPYLNTIPPWAVFEEARDKGVGCFCRQWSLVYAYLANVVGIPSRNLFTGGAAGKVDLGSHAFSESYVREEARWAYVDPTNDIAFATTADSRLVSGAEVYMAAISDTFAALTARVRTEAGFADKVFATVSEPVAYFMHRENFLIYVGAHDGRYQLRPAGPGRYLYQLYRFLFEPQQYFGVTAFESHHWLRRASFFVALAGALGFVLAGGLRLARRRR